MKLHMCKYMRTNSHNFWQTWKNLQYSRVDKEGLTRMQVYKDKLTQILVDMNELAEIMADEEELTQMQVDKNSP